MRFNRFFTVFLSLTFCWLLLSAFSGSPQPSYHQGLARNASESAYPALWQGLVAAWEPAVGVSGATLFDLSGFGSHGTLTNMDLSADWQISGNDREPGYALDFTDSTNQITIPSHPSTDNIFAAPGGTLVFSTLYRSDGGGASARVFHKFETAGWTMLTTSDASGNDIEFIQVFSGTNGRWQIEAGFVDDAWHHIAVVYDSSSTTNDAVMYLDGISRIIVEFQGPPTGTADDDAGEGLTIGNNRAGDRGWDGQVGSVKLYDRPLNASEVYRLYTDSLAPFRLRRPLVAKAPAVAAAVPERAKMGVGTRIIEKFDRRAYPCVEAHC